MNIKIQKIIKFIPVFNYLILFVWLLSYMRGNYNFSRFIKKSVTALFLVIVLTIPRIVLSTTFQEPLLDSIAFYISAYLIPYVLSSFFIKDQEELRREE